MNYTLGMILGVDDFVQEQVHQNAHREALARLGLGYGTLSGLETTLQVQPGSPYSYADQLNVGAGSALVPSGRLVHLETAQCCSIFQWFQANPLKKWFVDKHLQDPRFSELDYLTTRTGPGGGLWARAWAVLTYRENLCADVPIPGEACRTDDKLTAPSRIEDSWNLEITWDRPGQLEEDALRDFFRWILRIPFGDDLHTTLRTETELFDRIALAARTAWDVDPAIPVIENPGAFLAGKPEPDYVFHGELFRAVVRLWVTRYRARWCARYGWSPATTSADSILLTSIWIPVSASYDSVIWDYYHKPELDQDHRPVLLSLNALQNLVYRIPSEVLASIPNLQGDVTGTLSDNQVVALRHHPLTAADPNPGQILALDATRQWAPTTIGGDVKGPPDASKVVAIQNIAVETVPSPSAHQIMALTEDLHWKPTNIGGDLVGPIEGAKVVKIQGIPVSAAAPNPGEILQARPTTDGTLVWTPAPPGNAGAGRLIAAGTVRISFFEGAIYDGWPKLEMINPYLSYIDSLTGFKIDIQTNLIQLFIVMQGGIPYMPKYANFTPMWDPNWESNPETYRHTFTRYDVLVDYQTSPTNVLPARILLPSPNPQTVDSSTKKSRRLGVAPPTDVKPSTLLFQYQIFQPDMIFQGGAS